MSHSHKKNEHRKPEQRKPEIRSISANDLPPELAKAVMFCAFCKKQGKPVPNLTLDPVHRAILAQFGLVIEDRNVSECKKLHGLLVDAVKREKELLSAFGKSEEDYKTRIIRMRNEYNALDRKYENYRAKLLIFSLLAFSVGVFLTKLVVSHSF